jgi:hypothetical protein
MQSFECIEPDTETHRGFKAIKTLVRGARLPLHNGTVDIHVDPQAAASPGGQRLILMLVHLLARMKGIVSKINVHGVQDESVHPGIPLVGHSFADSLSALVNGLSGRTSSYACEFSVGGRAGDGNVRIAVGAVDLEADVRLGSNAWCVLTGNFAAKADWEARCPIGPYLTACFGVGEVFKRLLAVNFGYADAPPLGSIAFSLFDFSRDGGAVPGIDIRGVRISELAVAGAGAGGTAALYALASIEGVNVEVTVVDPGMLKDSSLGRYLMSDYEQVNARLAKVASVEQFFNTHVTGCRVNGVRAEWRDVRGPWGLTVCTVDTAEARLDVQRSRPREILEAGVLNGTLYAVLRVVPGGWCLECKHPYDSESTQKRRGLMWGLSPEEVRAREKERRPVSREDLDRLAMVQGRPVEEFLALEGMPFDQVPAVTECGETPISLKVPSQAAVLPFATTAAGVVLAGEVIKNMANVGQRLSNYFVHDLRHRLRADAVNSRNEFLIAGAVPPQTRNREARHRADQVLGPEAYVCVSVLIPVQVAEGTSPPP